VQAALVGAVKVTEAIFARAKETKPNFNLFFISYAICSGNTEWVKSLVKTFNLDITDPKLCFEVYARRVGNQALIDYYDEFDRAKSEKAKSEGASFFSPSAASLNMGKIPDIPEPLINCLQGLFDCIWDLINDCSNDIKPYIFSILQDSELEPKQAILMIHSFQENGAINFDLAGSFGLLFCALHPECWPKYPDKQHHDNIFRNTSSIYLSTENQKQLDKFIILLKGRLMGYIKRKFRDILPEFRKKPDDYEAFKTKNLEVQIEDVVINIQPVEDYLQTEQYEQSKIEPSELRPIKTNAFIAPGSKELTLSHPVWPKIYEIVKYIPQHRHIRKEKQMLNVIKSIWYKEEHHCRWQDLPKWSESVGKVYYYYRKWQAENLLNELLTEVNKALSSKELKPHLK
jgi:hypothetical protein